MENQGVVFPAPKTDPSLGPDEAWSKLRQGARNVAGVSWQIEVTTYLLAMGRAGFLKFRHFTPEGIEDVDCRDGDGFITYVQMKELAGGHGRMTASRVAEAIAHASKYTASRVVVVTDGQLGSELSFTGWEVDMRVGAGPGATLVKQHLTSAGMLETEADLLLGRTFLVQLPWDLRPVTERLLVDGLGVPPAVSALTVSRLYDLVALASADQRTTTAKTARVLTAGDVDAVLADIQSTVGLESLAEAVAAGVCAPASYVMASQLSPREFLLGADGAPGLIAAGLDVIRPLAMEAVLNGFSLHGYSLLVGPSGAGKSVLLWRAARDVLIGASVLRVLKVVTADDVELLVRHVTLQKPSNASPIVVAVDNLGRPNVGAWPDAVRRLREIPWVFLLGAARSEDFSPRLIAGGAALIELTLDETTADDIAEAVQDAGIEIRMDPIEARDRAEGLMMEYLALITAGQRFRDVIAEQVEGLRNPDRKLERTLARWVTAAHSVGLGLEAEVLPRLLEERDEIVGDALGRLRGEHVILKSDTEWRGLHELRSATISELLHESPPPTLTQTFSEVAQAVALPHVGWFLRRVAQEAPQAVTRVADIVSKRIRNIEDGLVVAWALEGAERADSLLYAARTLPILRQHTNSGLTVNEIAMFAYPVANQGFAAEPLGISGYDKVMQRMSVVAEQIGTRPAQVVEAIARGITGRDVVRLVSNQPPEFVARLLEAILDCVQLTRVDAQEIYASVPKPADADQADIYARIIYSLVALAELDHSQVSSSFGEVDSRASMLASVEPWALNVEVKESDDGVTVVATVLCPDSAPEKSAGLDWDTSPRSDDDPVHAQAMRIAQRLADGCPEAAVVEIQTVSPSGSRYVVADHEPGYKRLKRDVFKRRESVRRAVSYQAALRRLQASSSWTDLLREQVRIASELDELLKESHLRLAPADNAARRQAWVSDLADVQRSVKALKARPVAVAVDPADSHAQIDEDERSHDPVTRAFELLAGVLAELPQQRLPTGIAMNLEKALNAVAKAQQGGLPSLGSLGSPLPNTLNVSLLRLLKLQRAVAASPATARLIRSRPETVDRAISLAIEETHFRETALLNSCLSGTYSYRLVRAPSPEPSANSVDGCDILLLVDLATFDDLLADLRGAKHELRDGLTARVYVVAANKAAVLPIALQLTTHIAIDLIPVPLEERTRLFEAAELTLEPSPLAECVAASIQELARRSYAAALRRMRNVAWPTMQPRLDCESPAFLAADIPEHHPVVYPLAELDKQVVAEEAGLRPPGQLATVLNQMLSPQLPSGDETALLQVVSMAIVLSLQ